LGGGPRGKPGTAVDRIKEMVDHVNCDFSGLDCQEMHLEFVFCIHKACVLGKKNLHGKAETSAHAAVLAMG